MAFLAICTALYPYTPQTEGELPLKAGDLLYVLEKSDEDDWWKAKKKAESEDEDEPIGLVPNNYVEEAKWTHKAKALFEYSRQTEEELSFVEDDTLLVYDTTDPDWTLVGLHHEFGFVPAAYIEAVGDDDDEVGDLEEEDDTAASPPPLPGRPPALEHSSEPVSPASPAGAADPAANLAAVLGGHSVRPPIAPPPEQTSPRENSDEEAPPPMPQRPESQKISSPPPREPSPPSPDPRGIVESPPTNRVARSQSQSGPGGFHLYNINEMVEVMGKKKKMPTTLGINLGLGVLLVMPEKKKDGPQQEWTAEKLTHYSMEDKHVFMDFVKPSKSFDFHAGAKDTAKEICASLGELAGMSKAEGLMDVIRAGSGGQKKGHMLWDFMAQGDDEVTVSEGDEVIILDDNLSEEWWPVRRVKNGKEGVVPSSYVEVTGLVSPPPQQEPDVTPIRSGLSTVERNRLEEHRQTVASLEKAKQKEEQEERSSKRGSRTDSRSEAKSKPDQAKLRTWTDRSGSFKVEAQFIGLKDGKIHLHKVNGVKIAVPVVKMSPTDVQYVERMSGKNLDEYKPIADIKGKGTNGDKRLPTSPNGRDPGQPSKPEYDWFDFFLRCGVSPYQCDRYSYNFLKDSMDESVLPDIDETVLRNLGLKEGDILRVMKYLDKQFNRTSKRSQSPRVRIGGAEVVDDGKEAGATGIISKSGGILMNNTRKSRPAPPKETNDTIDSKLLREGLSGDDSFSSPRHRSASPEERPPKPPLKDHISGFDDDFVPAKQKVVKQDQSQNRAQSATPPAKPKSPPALSGAQQDLLSMTKPLEPTITHNNGAQSQPSELSQQILASSLQQATQPQSPQGPQQTIQQQQQGANPTFFNQLNSQPTGLNLTQQFQATTGTQPNGQFQYNPPRQRPQAPIASQQGSLIPPPPARPTSAPQNSSANNFMNPLQAQLTGYPGAIGYGNSVSPPPLNQFQPPNQLQPHFTGVNLQSQQFSPPQTGYGQTNALQPQMTAMPQQQFMNGQQTGSPFGNSIAPQSTGFQASAPGFQSSSLTGIIPQATGSVNSVLPPALQPQNTAVNGFGRPGFGQPPPPVPSIPSQFGGQQQQIQQPQQQQQLPPIPPIPQQPTVAPLQPQKTGPAPNVKFGVQPDAKKLAPQPTGRRANLAQATPENPFGF